MEPRRVNGKNHWYHETQSTICPVDVLPLVPEAAHVEDRFLLDLTLPDAWLHAHAGWLRPARQLAERLFPDQVAVSRLQTFTAYDRLSTALTVAQVYGVQRLCNHYAARLAPLPGPTLRARATVVWRRSPNTLVSSPVRPPSLTPFPAASWTKWA
jgi:uncharacterized protein YciW